MTAPSAIKGCFSDFKLIRTRSVCQLVIEIPLEQADAALVALGGLPRPDAERWVALARLDMSAAKKNQECIPKMLSDIAAEVLGDDPPRQLICRGEKPPEKKQEFCDFPFAKQAALKSNDSGFARFLLSSPGAECADNIRSYCGVRSRSEIIKGTVTGDRWVSLLRAYEARR